MERRKYLGRAYKDFYKSVTSRIIRVEEAGISGYASYLWINEVNRPMIVGEKGAEVCLADNGYSELDFLPDGENWRVSAMYDQHGEIIEWYFDITRKNAVDDKGEPYCDDLYLDAALMPDGRVLIFDEDELRDALTGGGISQADFELAYRVLNGLIDRKILDLTYMKALCSRLGALF